MQKIAYKIYESNFNSKNYNKFELITLLYEKLLKNMGQIEKSITINDIERKLKFINNSIDIINELTNSLDFKQGDVAYYLYGIYNDLNRRFVIVNANNDLNELKIVKNTIKIMYKTWQEEISKNL